MKTATVSIYNDGELVFGTEYEINGYLIKSDLKDMAEDSLSRCSKEWSKCGIEDDNGVLMIIFNKDMDEIPRINPNEDYWKLLQES